MFNLCYCYYTHHNMYFYASINYKCYFLENTCTPRRRERGSSSQRLDSQLQNQTNQGQRHYYLHFCRHYIQYQKHQKSIAWPINNQSEEIQLKDRSKRLLSIGINIISGISLWPLIISVCRLIDWFVHYWLVCCLIFHNFAERAKRYISMLLSEYCFCFIIYFRKISYCIIKE